MKKIFQLLIAGLSLTVIMGGCDVNDKFDGLDDLTKPTNVVSYDYQLVSTDYSTISDSLVKVAASSDDILKARSIKTYKAFPNKDLAILGIPYTLNNLFKYCDAGSSIQVTFDIGEHAPSFTILNTADYQYLWGDTFLNYVEAFTPANSPSVKMNSVLKNKLPNASEGDYLLAEYNYSSTEAETDNIEYKYFNEDFESDTANTQININGWTQIDTTGTKGSWVCKSYNNKYAQISSYGTNEENDVFLISKQVDLTKAINPLFTFDVAVAYWNATCLKVLISSNYDGNTNNISDATWTDLTSNFTLPETPTSGYGTLTSAGVVDLTGYVDKKVYIAFMYSGDSRTDTDPKITTTYQIDNVKVSEMRDALSIPGSEKQYAAYSFDGTNWINNNEKFSVLQSDDYTAMGLTYISTTNVSVYLPIYLKDKYPYALEGDMVNVVYVSSADGNSRDATQFVLENGEWKTNDYVIQDKAMFKFRTDGWEYSNADILVSLNTTTGISSNIGDFTIISVLGDNQTWKWDDTYGAKMSGYSSGYFDNEDWLVSPPMDLTERGDSIFLTFDHAGNYFGSIAGMMETAKVMISTTSDGVTIKESDWTELPLEAVDYPAGTNWTYVTTSPIKLSTYAGKSGVRIAFKYISTADPQLAGTWEIKNLHVYEKE